MNEITTMNKKILLYSISIGIGVAIVSGLLFNDIYVLIGILVGVITGLIGYAMIVHMALSLKPDEKMSKHQGTANYIFRYIIYAVIFGLFVYFKFSVIALLVGFLCHKLSIFIYALLEERKDKDVEH